MIERLVERLKDVFWFFTEITALLIFIVVAAVMRCLFWVTDLFRSERR